MLDSSNKTPACIAHASWWDEFSRRVTPFFPKGTDIADLARRTGRFWPKGVSDTDNDRWSGFIDIAVLPHQKKVIAEEKVAPIGTPVPRPEALPPTRVVEPPPPEVKLPPPTITRVPDPPIEKPASAEARESPATLGASIERLEEELAEIRALLTKKRRR